MESAQSVDGTPHPSAKPYNHTEERRANGDQVGKKHERGETKMTESAESSGRPPHPFASGEPPIACGYLRRGEGKRVSVPQLQQRIMTHARDLGFALYHPVFVDTTPGSPLDRPAFRVLLDVVWELHIPTLITPSIWHLSQNEAEADEVLGRLVSYDCRVIFMR